MHSDSPERARALMTSHAPHIRHALAGRPRDAFGAVLVVQDVDPDRADLARELVPDLHPLSTGVLLAVAPLDVVRELAVHLDPEAARHLARPPTPDHLWTLVVLPATVAAAPLTWDEPGASAAESSAPLPDASGLATFLRRWPETAHLAERLDPKPGASGKTTFDLGVTIGALEEFVRLIDALSIAHPDMRADADKARGAIPALRAKLRQAAN